MIRLDERKLYRVDHAPCHGQKFVTRILTCDLFASITFLLTVAVAACLTVVVVVVVA